MTTGHGNGSHVQYDTVHPVQRASTPKAAVPYIVCMFALDVACGAPLYTGGILETGACFPKTGCFRNTFRCREARPDRKVTIPTGCALGALLARG